MACKSKTASGRYGSSRGDKKRSDGVTASREQVPAGANRGQNCASAVGVWEGRGPGRAVFPGRELARGQGRAGTLLRTPLLSGRCVVCAAAINLALSTIWKQGSVGGQLRPNFRSVLGK